MLGMLAALSGLRRPHLFSLLSLCEYRYIHVQVCIHQRHLLMEGCLGRLRTEDVFIVPIGSGQHVRRAVMDRVCKNCHGRIHGEQLLLLRVPLHDRCNTRLA